MVSSCYSQLSMSLIRGQSPTMGVVAYGGLYLSWKIRFEKYPDFLGQSGPMPPFADFGFRGCSVLINRHLPVFQIGNM